MFSINKFKPGDTKKSKDNSRNFLGLYNNAFFEKNIKISKEIKKNMIIWCNKMTNLNTRLKIKDLYNEKEKLTDSIDNYFLQSTVICGFVFAFGFYMYRK